MTVRPLVLSLGILALWQGIVIFTGAPAYILPGPWPVARALVTEFPVLLGHLAITSLEMLVGLLLGIFLGTSCALAMIVSARLKGWLLPLLVISQALPVFALAPVLVLWLGYGMASKIAMALLIIFFPVAASFYQGMRRTNPELLELARIMGAGPAATLRYITIPSGLPAFAAGVRMAAAVAPIGAVVGEWVGASSGLGYYMLHANGRMQIDRMFAALAVLAGVSLLLSFIVDRLLARLIFWEPEKGKNS
ncbi:MAG: ABC transporter permease [Desulforhopalus sp.]|nr:ABC transporter permease [Desulforhopalus sp.]